MFEQERLVKIVPFTKIKKEVVLDEEDCVLCRLCGKGFVSELALNNHARMEHIDAYLTGDPNVWMEVNVNFKPNENLANVKTEPYASGVGSTSLMALASTDVSYIIVKSEDSCHLQEPKKKKTERPVKKADKPEKTKESKKPKETEPITGPFECLQPSNQVSDGTCHQIFFSCCEYSTHYRDEHTRRRKGLRCQVCEKPLASTGEDLAPYCCDTCGLGFQTSDELTDHMAVAHVKLKPYKCTICHKRFTQQGGVHQHMRMHTGDKPFPCTFCPKAFTQRSGLDQHLRIHTKVRPYRCVVCNKTFCQSVHLKQHMRTHTNVAPFQCGICEKRFKQSSHLNYHLKNHNPATMSEEQRSKYAELVGLMNKEQTEEQTVEAEEVMMDNHVVTEWCVTVDSSEIVGI